MNPKLSMMDLMIFHSKVPYNNGIPQDFFVRHVRKKAADAKR